MRIAAIIERLFGEIKFPIGTIESITIRDCPLFADQVRIFLSKNKETQLLWDCEHFTFFVSIDTTAN